MASAPGPADRPSHGIDLSWIPLIDRDPRLTHARSSSLERTIRELIAAKDYAKIEAILDQLCNDYAYAVHQPHARNGGLIGLAAAAIALGPVGSHPCPVLVSNHPLSLTYSSKQELPKYLEIIVPPVLACFTDQDARVRYYACEAMYNIAKVAKGEILVYFNYIFDALCKVSPTRTRMFCHTVLLTWSPTTPSWEPIPNSLSKTVPSSWTA